MNIFDIIAIAIFALTVLVCTFRGFLKIVARLGAFFAAFMLKYTRNKYYLSRVAEGLAL